LRKDRFHPAAQPNFFTLFYARYKQNLRIFFFIFFYRLFLKPNRQTRSFRLAHEASRDQVSRLEATTFSDRPHGSASMPRLTRQSADGEVFGADEAISSSCNPALHQGRRLSRLGRKRRRARSNGKICRQMRRAGSSSYAVPAEGICMKTKGKITHVSAGKGSSLSGKRNSRQGTLAALFSFSFH